MTEDDGGRWPAATHAREHAKGNKSESPEEFAHAGLVDDPETRRLLTHLARHYDPRAVDREMPARVEDTDLYQMILRTGATETLQRAVKEGRDGTLSYFVGDPGLQADVSGLSAIQQIENLMDKEAPIIYIKGEPGSGKTNISLLLAQVWVRIQQRHDLDYQVASNIRTLEAQDEWIERFSRLKSWAKEYVKELPEGGEVLREDAPRKLYIMDEASSHATGIGENGFNAGTLLGPLVKTIRKGNCGIIMIGHDGKDVHPAVRVLAKVVERYVEDKKRATLYHGIRNRAGVDEIVSLDGVPKTDWDYNDKEDTRFVWDSEVSDDDDAILEAAGDLAEEAVETDRRLTAARLYEMAKDDRLEATQGDIAEACGDYDQSWVSRAYSAYQQGKLSQEGDGMGIV
jgi:hypothetical protein